MAGYPISSYDSLSLATDRTFPLGDRSTLSYQGNFGLFQKPDESNKKDEDSLLLSIISKNISMTGIRKMFQKREAASE